MIINFHILSSVEIIHEYIERVIILFDVVSHYASSHIQILHWYVSL